MSLVAINTPKRTSSSIECQAVSCSQVRYEWRRKDGTFTTVSKTGGNKLILDDWSLEGSVAVGDRIYVKFDDDVVNAEGSITALLAAPVRIETDIDYSSATTARAGFCNDFDLRPNYRIKFTIDEFSDFISYATSGQEGLVVGNFGDILKDLMLQNDIQYSDFTLNKTEVWDGSGESPTAETELLITLSIRQILETFGANLWDHMLKTTPTPGVILTKFADGENRLWHGWKRTASVLVDPLASGRLSGETISLVTRNKDINNIFVSMINTVPISMPPAKILEYNFSGGSDFGTDFYTELYAYASPAAVNISNQILYENKYECLNPIMIEWLNSFGAWEQWLFEINQIFSTEADEGIIYEPGINDYFENITGIKKRITIGYTQRIQLKADKLTLGQLRALAEIKFSPDVRMFLEKDGSQYVEVVVYADHSDDYSTKGRLFEFNLSIEI